MKYYIYALVTDNTIFYIGRTIDPKRRLKEHQRDSKTGTELKYVFIRQLTECKGAWQLQILAEYCTNLHPYEDYWIHTCRLQGIELTNMRKGDIYTEAEDNLFRKKTTFDTPEAFFAARELEAKAITVEKNLIIFFERFR